MNSLDCRTDTRNFVLDMLRPGEAELRVDQDHPFFFDHPLDHVPGLLLLEGATQLVQKEAATTEYVARISAQFVHYAHFGSPIRLIATSSRDNDRRSFDVVIVQNDAMRARVEIDLRTLTHAAPACQANHAAVPCPADLLNKKRLENVLISEPRLIPPMLHADLVSPPSSCLLADSSVLLHPLYLLEAFMQTQRYLNRSSGQSERMRDILTGVMINQVSPTADRRAALQIRGASECTEARDRRLVRSASIVAGPAIISHCTIETARAFGKQAEQRRG